MPKYVLEEGVWNEVDPCRVQHVVKDGLVHTRGVWHTTPTDTHIRDFNLGYFGLVPAANFITGSELASAVGLSEGVSQHSDTEWVKMSVDGTTLLFPLKPIRHSLSWDSLSAANVVEGNRTVTIKGLVYKVRLFKGANTNPQIRGGDGADYGYNIESVRQSEWNRLIYSIHSGKYTVSSNPNRGSYKYGTLAQFSDPRLLIHHQHGDGTACWCQEVGSYGANTRVLRGYLGAPGANYEIVSTKHSSFGWRPILELVE